MDSYEKFKNTSLPEKKYFHSSLKDGKREAMDIFLMNNTNTYTMFGWNIFNFNNFEDFHNHYVKKDVLLSADVFEKFISICLTYYNLSPCHYISAPGLS